MTLIFLGQSLGAVCIAALGISTITLAMKVKNTKETTDSSLPKDVYMFATSDLTTTENKTKYEGQDFKCQFTNVASNEETQPTTEPFDCEISKLSGTPNKQHSLNWLTEIGKSNATPKQYGSRIMETDIPNSGDFYTSNNMFVVKFNHKHLGKDKENTLNQKLEIISTESPIEKQKNAFLKPAFAKHNHEIIGKTSFYVGKPSKDKQKNTDNSDTVGCKSKEKDEIKTMCQFFDFSDSAEKSTIDKPYVERTFKKNAKSWSSLSANRFYLIKFKNEDINKLKGVSLANMITVDITPEIPLLEISPAFYQEGYDHIFIFN